MTIRYLITKIAPSVEVWMMKDGCTDPSTFKHLTGFQAQKEYISSTVEVKDFRFDNNILFITI